MATFLFDDIIFGPVNSRRLGNSLGINLLPLNKKLCNFDCIYCECGLNTKQKGDTMPTRFQVVKKLEEFLQSSAKHHRRIDTITFAGNGEPTLHHEFKQIVEDTCRLRNTYYPSAKIALLTNSTRLSDKDIQEALYKIDQNILKLDSVHQKTMELLNGTSKQFRVEDIISRIKGVPQPIIQTMFVKGKYNNQPIDNTTEEELVPWLKTLRDIQPVMVMIYTIARDTPFDTLEKVPLKDLQKIASRVELLGIETQLSG
jgi:wyosine [tRNA(Phe)-imidazoG37] synthetase (radical SAM superfamily)